MASAPRPSGADPSPAIHQDASTERVASASDSQSEPGTARPVREPSMEEILASIRRIIAEDAPRTSNNGPRTSNNGSRSSEAGAATPTRTSRTQRQSPAHFDNAAVRRSKKLLEENLTLAQRQQYGTHLCFDVIGGESGKRYRLWERHCHNIEELDTQGHHVCLWCVRPGNGLPIGDILLGQKTALELYESDAIRIANRYSDFAANSRA